jgi:hypothetical protein
MKLFKLILITLLIFVASIQSSSAQETDVLDFLPSILAGVVNTDNDGDGYSENQGDCNDSNPDIYPTNDELCDGLDNDCDPASADGSEDPQDGTGCYTGQQGVCAAGTTNCVSGSLTCIANTNPSVEICSNDLDDDCDGQTDEEGCDNSFVSTRRTGMKELSSNVKTIK